MSRPVTARRDTWTRTLTALALFASACDSDADAILAPLATGPDGPSGFLAGATVDELRINPTRRDFAELCGPP